jgi:hypothetical protein
MAGTFSSFTVLTVCILLGGCLGGPHATGPSSSSPAPTTEPVVVPVPKDAERVFDLGLWDASSNRVAQREVNASLREKAVLRVGERTLVTATASRGSFVMHVDGWSAGLQTGDHDLLFVGAFLDDNGTVIEPQAAIGGWFVAKLAYPGTSQVGIAPYGSAGPVGQFQFAVQEASWASTLTAYSHDYNSRVAGAHLTNVWILVSYHLPTSASALTVAAQWADDVGQNKPRLAFSAGVEKLSTARNATLSKIIAQSPNAGLAYHVHGVQIHGDWSRIPDGSLGVRIQDSWEYSAPVAGNPRVNRRTTFDIQTDGEGPGYSVFSAYMDGHVVKNTFSWWRDNGTKNTTYEWRFENDPASKLISGIGVRGQSPNSTYYKAHVKVESRLNINGNVIYDMFGENSMEFYFWQSGIDFYAMLGKSMCYDRDTCKG